MDQTKSILDNLYSAWAGEDRDQFKQLVGNARRQGVTKDDIVRFLDDRSNGNSPADEDFENWAYLYIVTDGANDCTPG